MMVRKPDTASTPARTPEEVLNHHERLTMGRRADIVITKEARAIIRDFLRGLDENLTVAEVIATLEADWS